MHSDSKEFEWKIGNDFFEAMESAEVQKGQLKATLAVQRLADESFQFNFHTVGTVQVPCDHCLEDMDCPIDTQNMVIVKLGAEYMEDDDIVTIPEQEGVINVSEFIYQFIALDIPIKHVHAPGKCNTQMLDILNQHLAIRSGDQESGSEDEVDEASVDPRWRELLKIKK